MELTLTSVSFSFYVNPYDFVFLLMIFPNPLPFLETSLYHSLGRMVKMLWGKFPPQRLMCVINLPQLLLETTKSILGMSE